jgi:hypothetical protein
MTKPLEPAFAAQIQTALARGQTVVILPPGQPAPVATVRDKAALAATLTLMFSLRRGEGEVLMRLVTQDFVNSADIVVPPRISPSRERILEAIALDPAKSTTVLARELGVSTITVRKAREEGTADKRCGDGSLAVYICEMRKKLRSFGIEINTVWGHGYGLGEEARNKISRRLAEYDAGLIPTTPLAEPKADRTELST